MYPDGSQSSFTVDLVLLVPILMRFKLGETVIFGGKLDLFHKRMELLWERMTEVVRARLDIVDAGGKDPDVELVYSVTNELLSV